MVVSLNVAVEAVILLAFEAVFAALIIFSRHFAINAARRTISAGGADAATVGSLYSLKKFSAVIFLSRDFLTVQSA